MVPAKIKKIILNGNQNNDLNLNSGEFTYLAGASGTGKSTLLWTLARLHPLKAGILKLNDKLHTEIAVSRWRAEVALLPQKSVIMPGTIADNLLYPFHSFCIQTERLHERQESLPNTENLQTELDAVGLHDIPLEREASSLSGGQQARLALIRVLLTKPQIILADEPTAGLDETAVNLMFNRLHQFCEAGGTIILTSHTHGERVRENRIVLDGHGGLSY
ncbi:ATP binding protein of ABC transporter [Beggiatoa sp. PS]|nr:ATP binding protein of ABC transporter [Beggiatoa sp. PS]